MNASPAIDTRRQRPKTIKLQSAFAATSIVLLVLLVLAGEPQVGAALAAPWLSIALIQRPAMLFAAYLYIPFYKSVIQDYTPIDATVWLAVLSMVSFIVHAARPGRIRLPFVVFMWIVFAALIIAGTMWSIDIRHSSETLITTFALTILPLLLVFVVANDRTLVSSFLKVTLFGSVIFSVAGVVSLSFLDGQRLELTSNTIGSGRIAMMGLLIAPVVVPPGKKKPFVVAAIIALSLLATLATGSRGPLLAGALSLLAIYGIWTKWIALRVLGFVVAAAIGLAVLFSEWIEDLVPLSSLGRLRSLVEAVFGQGDLDGSSMARVQLMAEAVWMWNARSFTGWGIGSYALFAEENPLIEVHTYPHNFLLQIGAELGLIGFVAISVLVIWVLVRLYSGMRDPLVTGVAILTVFALISAQLSNNLYDNRWLWGMLLLGGSITFERATNNGRMNSGMQYLQRQPEISLEGARGSDRQGKPAQCCQEPQALQEV